MGKYHDKTQNYSSFGDKLLQHTDVLYSLQVDKKLIPITVQLAPIELCDSDCPFCSVAGRPLKSFIPFDKIEKCLEDFRSLGAKSLEISGGGNPLLYRDRETKKTINDIVDVAYNLGFDIGIITNSHNLTKHLINTTYEKLTWLRVSLIQLDEGRNPEDYNFGNLPYSKLGFSYIIYTGTGDTPDELSRTRKIYTGTSAETIERIARLVELHPQVKFVRIAGNCLVKSNNSVIYEQYEDIITALDTYHKFFIKEIYDNDDPFNGGCYVGAIRPYIAPNPHGGDYQVYICTSHVLNKRTYDLDYSLGSIDDVLEIWDRMSKSYAEKGYPYEVKCNSGKNWLDTCKYCYYFNNNKLLHTVAQDMPDKNFP